MPVVRITEAQDAYVHAAVQVTEEQLTALRTMSREQVDEWNTGVQSEHELDWTTGSHGEDFRTVAIDVLTDVGSESLWQEQPPESAAGLRERVRAILAHNNEESGDYYSAADVVDAMLDIFGDPNE